MGAKAATAALWTAAVLFAGLAALKVALYGGFTADSSAGCASEQNPGYVSACEQFAPVAWFGPYWFMILVFAVVAVLFGIAAVLASRGRRVVRVAMWATVLAIVLAVIPGAFDLDWRLAVAVASESDAWVAEYVHGGVPSWYGPVELAALVVAAVAAVLGAEWLRRSDVER
jgi:hypothetical protein